jgi:hypothetical protein
MVTALTILVFCVYRKRTFKPMETIMTAQIINFPDATQPTDLDSHASPIVAYTAHYQIEDMGDDWRGLFTSRFHLQMRADALADNVLARHGGANELADLLPSMHEAEAFHMGELTLMGRVSVVRYRPEPRSA